MPDLSAQLSRLDTLLEQLPEQREAAASLVHALIEQDEVLGMRQAVRFDAALYGEHTPEVAGSLARLGAALSRHDAVREAADTWVEAAKRFARDGNPVAGRLLVDAGFAYRTASKPDDAMAAFQRAVQLPQPPDYPTHKFALLGYAYIFATRDQPEDAMQACEEGLALPLEGTPDDFAAHAELWHAVAVLAEAFDAPALEGYALRAASDLHPDADDTEAYAAALATFEAEHPGVPVVTPDDAQRHVVHVDEGVTVLAHPVAGLERLPAGPHRVGQALPLPQ